METNYYTVLGVASNASDDDLRCAYRNIAKEHLDIADLREFINKFQELNTAFDVLLNDDQREEYDDELQRIAELDIPVERDAQAETELKLMIGSCTAFFVEPGEVNVLGEMSSSSGRSTNDYREVRFLVYDLNGKLIGTNYTNWSSFGRHQAFDVTIYYKPKKAIPARIVVRPSK